LDRPKLGVVANMRHFDAATVDQINQLLSRLDYLRASIQRHRHILSDLRDCLWMILRIVRMGNLILQLDFLPCRSVTIFKCTRAQTSGMSK